MIVVSISSAAGHSTSRSTTSSGSRLAKSNVRPTVAGDRHVGPPAAAVVGGHLRGRAVPEPGHDAGGLGGVGRRNVFADKRIHQRRLAGLQRAGQRDADGLVEPTADPVQLVVHVGALTVRRIGPVGPQWCRPGSRAPDRSCSYPVTQLIHRVATPLMGFAGLGLPTGWGADSGRPPQACSRGRSPGRGC